MAGKSQYDRLDSGNTRYPLHMIIGIFMKRIIKFMVLAIMMSAIAYFVIISTTVSRYIYVNDHGYVYTRNPNVDSVPVGTLVVFDQSKRPGDVSDSDSVLGRLSLAMLPSDSIGVGVIKAGPDGQITDRNGMIYVDNASTGMPSDNGTSKKYLEDEYIIQCSYGACQHGTYDILTENAVDGIVVQHKENK